MHNTTLRACEAEEGVVFQGFGEEVRKLRRVAHSSRESAMKERERERENALIAFLIPSVLLRYMELFGAFSPNKNFYFSYTYELTQTLQYNMQICSNAGEFSFSFSRCSGARARGEFKSQTGS